MGRWWRGGFSPFPSRPGKASRFAQDGIWAKKTAKGWPNRSGSILDALREVSNWEDFQMS